MTFWFHLRWRIENKSKQINNNKRFWSQIWNRNSFPSAFWKKFFIRGFVSSISRNGMSNLILLAAAFERICQNLEVCKVKFPKFCTLATEKFWNFEKICMWAWKNCGISSLERQMWEFIKICWPILAKLRNFMHCSLKILKFLFFNFLTWKIFQIVWKIWPRHENMRNQHISFTKINKKAKFQALKWQIFHKSDFT